VWVGGGGAEDLEAATLGTKYPRYNRVEPGGGCKEVQF
jgi:hypothetical protein